MSELRAIRAPGLAAIFAFCAFVIGFASLLNARPEIENQGYARLVFVLGFVVLIVVELAIFQRLRHNWLLAAFKKQYTSRVVVVGTSRKGWFPLFERLAARDDSPVALVWWRARNSWPLACLALRVPPVNLPFAVVINGEQIVYISLAESLRSFKTRPGIAEHAAIFERICAETAT